MNKTIKLIKRSEKFLSKEKKEEVSYTAYYVSINGYKVKIRPVFARDCALLSVASDEEEAK